MDFRSAQIEMERDLSQHRKYFFFLFESKQQQQKDYRALSLNSKHS